MWYVIGIVFVWFVVSGGIAFLVDRENVVNDTGEGRNMRAAIFLAPVLLLYALVSLMMWVLHRLAARSSLPVPPVPENPMEYL